MKTNYPLIPIIDPSWPNILSRFSINNRLFKTNPWKVELVLAATGAPLPLGLGGEPFAGPLAIGGGIVEADVNDGMRPAIL